MSLTPPAPIHVSSLDPQISGRIMENTAGSIYVLAVQSARSRATYVRRAIGLRCTASVDAHGSTLNFGLLHWLSGRCISVSSNTRSRLEQRAARMEYEGDDDPGI